MSSEPIVLIPARMAATRLPGKPLADIEGVPMIVRAVAMAAKSGYRVCVAAGDAEIVEAVREAGFEGCLTDPALPSGSDRILAALHQIDPGGRHDTIINLQGDMPFAPPSVTLATAAVLAEDSGCDIATLIAPPAGEDDRNNPDVVKAIMAMEPSAVRGRALYFTRAAPFQDAPVWRHIGIYGYRRAALEAFCSAPPSALERAERLEQLRALEMGLVIKAAVIEAAPLSVDNPADLEAARAVARNRA